MAQLVEHHLAKVGVAGSNPVVRSMNLRDRLRAGPFLFERYGCVMWGHAMRGLAHGYGCVRRICLRGSQRRVRAPQFSRRPLTCGFPKTSRSEGEGNLAHSYGCVKRIFLRGWEPRVQLRMRQAYLPVGLGPRLWRGDGVSSLLSSQPMRACLRGRARSATTSLLAGWWMWVP